VFRLLPIFFIIAALLFGLFQYLPIKREVLYKLGISGDPTASCCNVKDVLSSNGNFDESANIAFFDGQTVDYPKTSLAYNSSTSTNKDVLGTTNASGEEKWIEVDLSKQLLTAWEGNRIVMQYPISSGRWSPTPTGTFNIWYKTRYQRMTGGSKELGTFYDLPNVPDNMFFYQGYGIHGAYWHNNFGHPMSHGCVNEPLAEAAALFEWAGPVLPDGQNAVKATAENPGTRVYIH